MVLIYGLKYQPKEELPKCFPFNLTEHSEQKESNNNKWDHQKKAVLPIRAWTFET